MPRFLVYAPDLPNVLDKRMVVRPEHVARAQPDLAQGINIYGGAMLPRTGTAARDATLPRGQANYAGSFMVLVFDSADQVWDRLKEDVYWREDIWDKDRVIVEELID